ncbi:MAG: hypothetical protein ABI639_14290 [Thermoanaerobaculia bacterium]
MAPVPVQPRSSRAGQLVFADRVWRVEESNTVAKYTTYIFLADRTLIVDSWKGIPGIGKWEFEEGKLALIEEGIRYPAAILELKDDRFRLRIDGPGEPVRLDLRENRPE